MKKVAITQDLCRMVELMLKGGAQQKEVGERLGISKTTVSRIKAAGFDPEQYARNTQKRVEEENKAEADPEPEQVPGQICMELQPAEEQKPEMSDQTKLMRFLAGKTEELKDNAKMCSANIGLALAKIDARLDVILRMMDG